MARSLIRADETRALSPSTSSGGTLSTGRRAQGANFGEFDIAPGAQEIHLRGVESAIAGIERGDFYQLNLCTRLRAPLSGRPAEVFAGGGGPAAAPLRGHDRLPGAGRSMISFSPELFLAVHGAHVRTSPIKGTSADRRGSRRLRPGRVAQGRGREHHDHRSDAQRPLPGLPARNRSGRATARAPASSRRLAPGLHRRRRPAAGHVARGPAAGDLPAGLGHRGAQDQRAGGHRRAWSRRPGAPTPARSASSLRRPVRNSA